MNFKTTEVSTAEFNNQINIVSILLYVNITKNFSYYTTTTVLPPSPRVTEAQDLYLYFSIFFINLCIV